MFSNPFILSFSLLLFLPILFLLAPKILPTTTFLPPSIPPSDELDDLSLFNRAAASSSSLSRLSSPNAKLKIAFLFLTNSDLHFSPLWNRFFKKAGQDLYNVYIHADPTVNITLESGVFKSKRISSKRTYRSSPPLVSASRRLLATAILDDPANVDFALLSQHCIPLRSFKHVYHSLIISTTFDFSSPSTESASEFGVRLNYKSFIEVISQHPRLWKRYAMMPEVPFDKFRMGSQLTNHFEGLYSIHCYNNSTISTVQARRFY